MNEILLICGLALLGSTPTQENIEKGEICNESQTVYLASESTQDLLAVNFEEESQRIVTGFINDCEKDSELDLDEIVYIEEEPEIELGFDTAEYLPMNFDPYAGTSEQKDVATL